MSSWWDRFGQEWAHVGLTDDPTFAQADAGWAYIGQAPPTVEQFNSMFQWNDDKDNWLYGQIANVIMSADMLPDENDLTQLLRAITSKFKTYLTAPLALYVDPVNGDDSLGDGTNANPWKRVQHAFQYIWNNIDAGGQTITIQLSPGVCENFIFDKAVNGVVVVNGDSLNPRAYTVKNTNGQAVWVSNGVLCGKGFSVEAAGTPGDYQPSGTGVIVGQNGIFLFKDLAFGPCSNAHVWVAQAGQYYPLTGAGTAYSVYGSGGQCHFLVAGGGVCTIVRCNITVTNNPAFSQAFAIATQQGLIQSWAPTTITGTAVGSRYFVDLNGIINASGAGVNLFPGTTPGTLGTHNGVYLS